MRELLFYFVTWLCLTEMETMATGKEYTELFNKCKEKYGLSKEEAVKSLIAVIKEKYLEDERKRCFIVCTEEGEGYLKDGRLDEDHIVHDVSNTSAEHDCKLNEEKFRTDVKKCAMKGGDGKCEAAYNSYTCLVHLLLNLNDYKEDDVKEN
ncbi:uncharacterized protein [Periplaneta americana]|uniref:uncharacterized protein n=1 Tax=Periplaneta americana TaxID=6978 RepID=UPI0037E811B7